MSPINVNDHRVHGPCPRPCSVPAVYIHVYKTVYMVVYGPYTRLCTQAIHIHGSVICRVHGHGHGRCTPPCRRRCTGPPVPCMYPCVHGCVHGLCIRPRTRHIHVHPCTRPVNETYTICNFVISCNLCIQKYTSVNKAKHHIAFHRKLIKYGLTVKRHL